MPHQLFLTDFDLVDGHSFSECWNMRRDKQACFVTRQLKTSSGLNGNCTLSISASHMYSLEIILRITEIVSEIPHLIYVGLLPGAELPIHVPLENPPQTFNINRLNRLWLHSSHLIVFTSFLSSCGLALILLLINTKAPLLHLPDLITCRHLWKGPHYFLMPSLYVSKCQV